MDTNTELYNHIVFEFYSGLPNRENILFESRGVVSGLHDVIKHIVSKMRPQIRDTFRKKEEIYGEYDGSLSEFGISSFFDDYKIELTTKINQNISSPEYSGGLYPKKSFFDTETGVVCSPYIVISITGRDENDIYEVLMFVVGHELTHAYNLLAYAEKNKCDTNELFNNYLYGQKYSRIHRAMHKSFAPNQKTIAQILYLLNRMERNAYISQLKQELEAKSDNITDTKSAWNAVRESESYKKLKALESCFDTMFFNGSLSQSVKNNLITYTNDIIGSDFKNYSQLKKYYLSRWYRWKKKYLSAASKIAYDVFSENNPMIDGFRNNEPLIKPN